MNIGELPVVKNAEFDGFAPSGEGYLRNGFELPLLHGGQEIRKRTITADVIQAGSITATELEVDELSAISANLGTITAGSITGVTITGGTLRTAATGARVQMTGSDNRLSVYDSSRERLRMDQDELIFYASDGNEAASLFGDGTGTTAGLTLTSGNIIFDAGTFYFEFFDTFETFTIADSADILFRVYGGHANGVEIGDGSNTAKLVFSAGSTRTLTIQQLGDGRAEYRTNGTHRFLTDNVDRMSITDAGVDVHGALTKSSGSFDIPHPDPDKAKDNYRLRHCFVESPTAGDNIYRYQVDVVDGYAIIPLPDYFKHLNENPQGWVTPVDTLGVARIEVDTSEARIYANKDGVYNVLIIGTRKDKAATDHFAVGVEYQGVNA